MSAILSPASAAIVLPFLRDPVAIQRVLSNQRDAELREAFHVAVREIANAALDYQNSRGAPRSVTGDDSYVSTAVAAEMLGVTERQVRNLIAGDLLRARRPEGARAWRVERRSIAELLASSNR